MRSTARRGEKRNSPSLKREKMLTGVPEKVLEELFPLVGKGQVHRRRDYLAPSTGVARFHSIGQDTYLAQPRKLIQTARHPEDVALLL